MAGDVLLNFHTCDVNLAGWKGIPTEMGFGTESGKCT